MFPVSQNASEKLQHFDTVSRRIYILYMRLITAIALLLCFSGIAQADDASYYIGPRSGADLYASPNKRAEVTAHLPRKSSVKVLQKRRNWWKVETLDAKEKRSGWVFEGAVRKQYKPSKAKKGSSSFFSGFASYFRSPEPAQKTAVLGVRGLEDDGSGSAERAATERANHLVKWMDTLNVPDDEVDAFIEEGDLNP